MNVEDRTRIKKVVFKHPEFMASNADILVKEEYYALQKKEHDLAELRMKVIELEKELKERKDKFRKISDTFTLEFESKNIDYKTQECNIVVSNSTDARYASYGK